MADAEVAYNPSKRSSGTSDVAIRSPAKNRRKGTPLDAEKRVFPLMFERAACSWWNPQFDSEVLEHQHEADYYTLYRRRFRSALLYVLFVSVAWAVFFGVMGSEHWVMYLGGAVVVAVLTTIVLALTFTSVYMNHYKPMWFVYAVLLCVGLLLGYTYLGTDLSAVGAFASTLELLLLMYTLIPLPLYLCVSITGLYSIIFEVLSGLRTSMTSPGMIVGRALLHVCIHMVGMHLFVQWQARKRSTFLRVGQSILLRHQMKQDQAYKQNMIQSLMPKSVADNVMETRKEKDEQEFMRQQSDIHPSAGPALGKGQGKMKFRDFHMSQMQNVSILFADIVGFTRMSSGKQADHLVSLLNDLFGRFDILCQKNGCEKISTLGDCYYCVAGCPEAREDHASCCIQMGLHMCKAIIQFDIDHNEDVNMRVGVHTGTVLCGLVGTRRFKFDVWSNDVTLANSMESEGEAGLVHISQQTLDFVPDLYNVKPAKEVPDIRKHKVLIEDYNQDTQKYEIRHIQEQTTIKTYFVLGRKDGRTSTAQSPKLSEITPPDDIKKSNELKSDVQIVVEAPTDDEPSTDAGGDLNKTDEPTVNDGGDAKTEDTLKNGQSEVNGSLLQKTESHLDLQNTTLDEESEENKTALLNQLQARTSNAETDKKMVEQMAAERNMQEYLHRPPINHFTLTFDKSSYERSFHQHYLQCKVDESLTLANPRLTGAIDMLVSLCFLILISVAIFLGLPLSPVWLGVFALFLLLEVVMALILLLDLIKKGENSSVSGLLGCAASWYPRNAFGMILSTIPVLAVYINFSCMTFDTVAGCDLFYCILILASLVHFCNFTMLSSWLKSCIATIAGIVILLLVVLGACGPVAVSESVSNSTVDYSVMTTLAAGVIIGDGATLDVNTTLVEDVMFGGEHALRWEMILSVLLLLVLIFFLNREFEISYRLSFHGDHQAKKDQHSMEVEKEQADWLLHNIIPAHVIDVLKSTSKYSQNHKDVGVVFAKVVNFDDFYDESFEGGREYYRVLNELISDMEDLFDDEKFKDIEKIKTIGSCLMVACGLNETKREQNNDPDAHLYALMDFCVELLKRLDDFNAEIFNFDFEMAIGFNFGDITSGVIGTTKLLYDIWGDAVNVSSRMYSTGPQGRIQVPEKTAERLKEKFDFDYRGTTTVKGKGEMATYLLVGRKEGATWS